MTPDRWKAIKHIFQAAVEQPVSERGAFLKNACADDPTLIPEIESLLDAYHRLSGFLEPRDGSNNANEPIT